MLDQIVDERTASAAAGLPWIGSDDLARLISMPDAITLVDSAMQTLSAGEVESPERWAMPVSPVGRMGIMPGASVTLGCFGIKVLSLFDPSARTGLPSHQGVMLIFDISSGRPLGALHGAGLTALRTAAASAVATRALARPDSTSLAIIGCGDQALLHVDAIRAVLPIERLAVWNRTRGRAQDLVRDCAQGLDYQICDTPSEAVRDADIICTLTAAGEPILFGADLSPGQHINLVGSSTAGPREVDDAFVARSRYFVDSREHALSQGAELRSAIDNGVVGSDHILGEIGEVLSGTVAGRLAPTDITVYKSLGHIAQDLAVGRAALRAMRRGMMEQGRGE